MREEIDETAVIVAGAGPAGLTAAIALGRAGVETLVLERRMRPPRLPRATALSTSTMELMRSWGLEAEVREGDLDVELRPWVTETLATASAGHAVDAGFPTRDQSELISPTSPAGVPQDHLEPVLERHLRSLPAARIERGAEVIDVQNGRDGVAVTVRDVQRGDERRVRGRYLIGADGIRSRVRAALAIPPSRQEHVGDRVADLFRAPLWELLGEHRYVIYFLMGPARGSAVVPAGPERWQLATDWDPARESTAALTPAEATEWIRDAAGAPRLRPRIEHVARVEYAVDVAERFRAHGVFLVGDAAHRVSPRGATGLNTAIRDGYDLAWKLAWVLRGWADERLLHTYEAERRPVAEHNAARSSDPNGSERAVTEVLRADLGGRIAHLWVPTQSERVSTLDLLVDGLTVFTGPGGDGSVPAPAWASSGAPRTVRRLDRLTAHALGISSGGALLVRPDGVPATLSADTAVGAASRAA